MQLPDSFKDTIKNVHKEDGGKFLAVLPDLIKEVSRSWRRSDIETVPNLSFHFVAFEKRDNEAVVLKLGVPNPELTSEINALKLFNGNGACQLLESDEERGVLLLERLKPGRMLAELEDEMDESYSLQCAEIFSKMLEPSKKGQHPGWTGFTVDR